MSGPRAIRSTRAFVDGAFRPAAVVVEGGRVADVLGHGEPGPSLPVDDLGDLWLLPGLVDPHVHMNEPGRTEWEGFATATRAAAAGGVTTLVDMPLNCIPVTTSAPALETKLEAARDLLAVDVGFWGGVVPGNARELAKMVERGALGAKCFLCHSGIDDFPASTEADLREAMPVLRDANAPLLVHAELERPGAPACAGDVRSYATYLASRPRAWEDDAVALMVALCRATRCPVHIVHLSSSGALDALRRAKDEGLPFSAETCPHYLCLSAEEIAAGATEFKCAPPIREAENREKLWAAVREGLIDLVTSDHSPCTPGLKKPAEGDFCGAWGGIASLSLGLPSVLTAARARGVAPERVVTAMSEAPARLAGLARTKGRIARGFDADLCAFDPDARWVVRAEALPFRHKVSPYVGRELQGRVVTTWLRGEATYGDGAREGAAGGRPLLGRR
ncbi:MAG TPA: allantoinase AllB [Polyangiaceae bacterium]|nr:allantoinase AllB [Polyangiaceae bacterium]